MARGSRRERNRVPSLEKVEQWAIYKLARQVGCNVLWFSQPFRATQTKGIADLRIYPPKTRSLEDSRAVWFEVKKVDGPQSDDQATFASGVTGYDERYICGGMYEFIDLLIEWGIVMHQPPVRDMWDGKPGVPHGAWPK